MKQHHNHIILSDGVAYYLFERLGKKVPFGAYNPSSAIFRGETIDEILENSPVPLHDVEKRPYEVIFNE